jgi:tol-pal system protein YbgF
MKRILSAFFLLALLVLSGCMTTGGGGGGGNANLSARLDRQEQQIQMLLSQVGQVEQVLPGQAEMWSQMQTMRQELNMLNGRIDDSQGGGLEMIHERLNRMEAALRQMGSQLGVNVDAFTTSSAGGFASPHTSDTPFPPSGGAGVTQTAPAEASGDGDAATALYDAGIKAFDSRRYTDAVVAFKDFAAAHPKHRLAGNAYFWQGESYFQLKDYARAALAYQEVIVKFPGSSKMQSSMLKQGMALYHADKKAAGRERLQELVKRYPNSPEAGRANQFLAQNK